MKEELLSGPLMTPKKTRQSNGVKFFSLNRSVLEYRRPGVGNPVTHVKNQKLKRSKLLLENTTRARKVNKTKEHTASIDGYKYNIVLITATNNENLLSPKFVKTTEGQLLM